jgi:hypothetical protein
VPQFEKLAVLKPGVREHREVPSEGLEGFSRLTVVNIGMTDARILSRPEPSKPMASSMSPRVRRRSSSSATDSASPYRSKIVLRDSTSLSQCRMEALDGRLPPTAAVLISALLGHPPYVIEDGAMNLLRHSPSTFVLSAATRWPSLVRDFRNLCHVFITTISTNFRTGSVRNTWLVSNAS